MPNRAAEWLSRVAADHGGYEVVERHPHGLKVRLPDGRKRLTRSIGPSFHTRGGLEVDTDLDDDSGGFLYKSRVLDYGLRVGAGGRRRITPRPEVPAEFFEVGRPQSQAAGGAWSNIPFSSVSRQGNLFTAQGTGYKLTLSVKPNATYAFFTLDSLSVLRPFRWPMTLTGLSYVEGGPGAQDTIVSLSDGSTVMWLGVPKWWDSTPGMPKGGEVTATWANGYLTYAQPSIPADAVWPIVVDPDFHAHIGGSVADGYITQSGSFIDAGTEIAVSNAVSSAATYSTWLYFASVTIAPGSTVSAAHIHLISTYRSNTAGVLAYIALVDEDDHAYPTTYATWNTDHGIHTTATTNWDFTQEAAGTEMITPNFATSVYEVVSRAGWHSGHAIGVHIDSDGISGSGTQEQDWASYEHLTYAEPTIDITYTEPVTNQYSWGMLIG